MRSGFAHGVPRMTRMARHLGSGSPKPCQLSPSRHAVRWRREACEDNVGTSLLLLRVLEVAVCTRRADDCVVQLRLLANIPIARTFLQRPGLSLRAILRSRSTHLLLCASLSALFCG